MSEIKELLDKIQKLRVYINKLVEDNDNLTDSEILEASKILDGLLNEYEKMISDKKHNKGVQG